MNLVTPTAPAAVGPLPGAGFGATPADAGFAGVVRSLLPGVAHVAADRATAQPAIETTTVPGAGLDPSIASALHIPLPASLPAPVVTTGALPIIDTAGTTASARLPGSDTGPLPLPGLEATKPQPQRRSDDTVQTGTTQPWHAAGSPPAVFQAMGDGPVGQPPVSTNAEAAGAAVPEAEKPNEPNAGGNAAPVAEKPNEPEPDAAGADRPALNASLSTSEPPQRPAASTIQPVAGAALPANRVPAARTASEEIKPVMSSAGDITPANRARPSGFAPLASAPGTSSDAVDPISQERIADHGASSVGRAAPISAETTAQRPAPVPAATQVAVQLAGAARGRIDHLTVQLEPHDLGRVDVRLDFGEDGRVTAVITADRPETLDALQRESRGLERALLNAGLIPDDKGLSFGLRQDRHEDGDTERQAASGSADDEMTDQAMERPTLTVHGLLDIHA